MPPHALQAALAAHRFGLGEADLATVGADAPAWLTAQIGPAAPAPGEALPGGAEAAYQRSMQGEAAAQWRRQAVQADAASRLASAVGSPAPFNERLVWFWANHFTVSLAKGAVAGLVGAFEREAIRPHIAGRFTDLLRAATTHAAMLVYLDNHRSAGPASVVVRRRARRAAGADGAPARLTGLNENLARELLELHTLGVAGGGDTYGGWGGYGQADVTELARLLTGWRLPPEAAMAGAPPGTPSSRFDPDWHEPGPKTVLGRRHAEGPQALAEVLAQLAVHPSTARHLCHKLARHFVADVPPPALVARLAACWQDTGGDLGAVCRALVQAPEAWQPAPVKLKSPEEFVVSTARLLRWDGAAGTRQAAAVPALLGQRLQAAPSPAGWPDQAEEWLGPDALWKRVEWATRVAGRAGATVDARALAAASLGPLLQDGTRRQIERAADGAQALALLLLAPEFQRR